MDTVQFIILGLIQGITEFLPISSSAHLILLPQLTGWQDQGLVNDVAAHVGSLVAVIVYFHRDLKQILLSASAAPGQAGNGRDNQLLICIVLATLPIMIIGYLLYDLVSAHFRNPLIIAVASIVFGLVLWWSDRAGNRLQSLEDISVKQALWIGLAQTLALIPGTSRAGITMTAGLFLGMTREAAARFSFLLAIPTIMMAGGHEGWRYFMQGNATDWPAFFLVAVASGLSAWVTIHYFLKFLQKTGMLPYVIYRIGLGLVLLVLYV